MVGRLPQDPHSNYIPILREEHPYESDKIINDDPKSYISNL